MTKDEATKALDKAAFKLARAYLDQGYISYTIRLLDTGEVRIIGPSMPSDVVADLFEKAAQGYADSQADEAGSLN